MFRAFPATLHSVHPCPLPLVRHALGQKVPVAQRTARRPGPAHWEGSGGDIPREDKEPEKRENCRGGRPAPSVQRVGAVTITCTQDQAGGAGSLQKRAGPHARTLTAGKGLWKLK